MTYQKLTATVLALALFTASAGEKLPSVPMKYEGGSLPLDPHGKLKVAVQPTAITIFQGKRKFAIDPKSVTEVSYGNDVHRRVGPAIGVGAATLGIGLMMLLVKTKKHYVGIVWHEPGGEKNGGVVFKVGKGEYRGFIASLEGITGKRAVDSDRADAKR